MRFFVVGLIGLLMPTASMGASQFSFAVDQFFTVERNILTSTNSVLPEGQDDEFYSLYLNAYFQTDISTNWQFLFEFNTGALRFDGANFLEDSSVTANGQPLDDEFLDSDLFIRQFYFDYALSNLQISLGKQYVESANGYLIGDFQWGASADYKINQFTIGVDAYLIERDSAFLQARTSIDIGSSKLLPFFSLFFDRGNNLARVVQNGLALAQKVDILNINSQGALADLLLAFDFASEELEERLNEFLALNSDSNIGWFGVGWSWSEGALSSSVLGVFQLGKASFGFNRFFADFDQLVPINRSFTTLGYLFDAEFIASVANFKFGPFYFHSSGDDSFFDRINDGQTRTFLPILPFNTRASLFFNSGGVQGDLSTRSGATLGTDSKGVIAPGWQIEFDWQRFSIENRYVLLFSEFGSNSSNPDRAGGRFFGFEVDFEAEVAIWRHLAFISEVNFLKLGNFFDFSDLDDIFEMSLGLSLSI